MHSRMYNLHQLLRVITEAKLLTVINYHVCATLHTGCWISCTVQSHFGLNETVMGMVSPSLNCKILASLMVVFTVDQLISS